MNMIPDSALPDASLQTAAAIDPAEPSDRYFELYKLAVEMADRVSARRGIANSFFLTINTAVLALVGTRLGTWYPAAAGIAVCVTWWALLRSYRDLNRAKFDVILDLEALLPARLYGDEWALLRRAPVAFGLQPALLLPWLMQYRELGYIERIVPWIFSALYMVAIITKAVH